MQNKYKDNTVFIEVVQVVIEIDSTGKQMQERYAMSKLMANYGKDKTTTCHSEYFPSCYVGGKIHLGRMNVIQLTIFFYSDCSGNHDYRCRFVRQRK